MSAVNYICEYYAKIQSDDENFIAGKWIKKLYAIIVKGMEEGQYIYAQNKADNVIEFIENFCRHSEGRNDLITLELWQKALLSVMFGIVDDNGLRVFREVLLVIARKNGKTLLASAIMAYMAYLDGEYGASIYCIAPKLELAGKAFEGFYQMVTNDEELKSEARRRRSDIYIEETNTTVKPIAFSAKKSDGFNPHLVVCDEVSSWVGDAGIKQYGVMKSAFGARQQPIMLSITTAGYVNDGIFDELVKRGTAFLNGGSKERRLLPFIYQIDKDDNWRDIDELKKANPNMDVSVKRGFFLDNIAAAEISLSERAEFLTKFCNVKQNSSVAWLEGGVVERATIDETKIDTERGEKIPTLEDFRGSYAVGGFDLSRTTDLTAAVVIIERGGKLYTFARFFMPANKLEEAQASDGVAYDVYVKKGILTLSGENHVNYKDISTWYMHLREEYEIYTMKIGYDRYSSQYLVDELKNNGFHMDDVWQGENLTPVIYEFEGILKDGNFFIVDNNLLKVNFLNVALKQNLETRKIRPVKIDQRSRIDGFVAVIDALTVRQKYWNEVGEMLKNAD